MSPVSTEPVPHIRFQQHISTSMNYGRALQK